MDALYKLLCILRREREEQFEWNPSTKHDAIVLSKNNKAATPSTARAWYKCIGKNLLSSQKYKKVIWELTITEREEEDRKWFCSMGYVAQQELPQMEYETPIGAARNECGLRLRNTLPLLKIHNDSDSYPWHKKLKSNIIKRGDRLKLCFDYIARQCRLYLNDQEVGILTNNLPDNIYPAVSLCYRNRVETTSFILYR